MHRIGRNAEESVQRRTRSEEPRQQATEHIRFQPTERSQQAAMSSRDGAGKCRQSTQTYCIVVCDSADRSGKGNTNRRALERRLTQRPGVPARNRQAIQVRVEPLIEPTQMTQPHVRRSGENCPRCVQDGCILDVLSKYYGHDQFRCSNQVSLST